jgi:hypothetical protein
MGFLSNFFRFPDEDGNVKGKDKKSNKDSVSGQRVVHCIKCFDGRKSHFIKKEYMKCDSLYCRNERYSPTNKECYISGYGTTPVKDPERCEAQHVIGLCNHPDRGGKPMVILSLLIDSIMEHHCPINKKIKKREEEGISIEEDRDSYEW